MRSDIRNLSRYLVELEELIEGYHTFTLNAQLTTQADRTAKRTLLKRTQKIVGPMLDAQSAGKDS